MDCVFTASVRRAVPLFITAFPEVCRVAIRVVAPDFVSIVPVEESCWTSGGTASPLLNTTFVFVIFCAYTSLALNKWSKRAQREFRELVALQFIARARRLTALILVNLCADCLVAVRCVGVLPVNEGVRTVVCKADALWGAAMRVGRGQAINIFTLDLMCIAFVYPGFGTLEGTAET